MEKTTRNQSFEHDLSTLAAAVLPETQRHTPSNEHSRKNDVRDTASHEQLLHEDVEQHHHHSHADSSRHEGGHHLLQVEDLSISFRMYEEDKPFFQAKQRLVPTVHHLSLAVHRGEIVAVVGASGSGKTLLADSLLGLFEPNAQVEGRIWFDGALQTEESLRQLAGKRIALVPQSVASLDPLMKVGKQIEESSVHTSSVERREQRQRLFERYNLDENVANLYPFELSGGMARRVLLSCALMESPDVLVADEPTPGLDLDLAVRALDDFREFARTGGGVILITHDIELALRVADRVAVFHEGTVVEETAVENFSDPRYLKHPFSKALWHALPEHDFFASHEKECKKGSLSC